MKNANRNNISVITRTTVTQPLNYTVTGMHKEIVLFNDLRRLGSMQWGSKEMTSYEWDVYPVISAAIKAKSVELRNNTIALTALGEEYLDKVLTPRSTLDQPVTKRVTCIHSTIKRYRTYN